MKDARNHAGELLQLAHEDLVSAEAIAATGQAFRSVCFHAQQLAEKSLKALLAVEDLAYPKTHDLGELVTFGSAVFPVLLEWADELDVLTPYAVAGRYGMAETPTPERAQALLDIARRFGEWARRMVMERLEAGNEGQQAGN